MAFQHSFPDVRVELLLAERHADLSHSDTGMDIEIRIGRAPDPALESALILPTGPVLVASPAYLDAAPPLHPPADLAAGRLRRRSPISR